METATLIKRLDAIESETKSIRRLLAKSGKVTDRLKTVEDAFNEVGLDYKIFKTNAENCGLSDDEMAYCILKIIAKALNEGWTPNWEDSNERKYYPWFEYKKGSGFVYHCVDYWSTLTDVGSRLCFKNAELAKYAATQFIEVYNRFLK